MADLPGYRTGVSNWTPSVPKKGAERAEGLMAVEARDAKDTMNADNELKAWVGGSGKPDGPYGVQGRKF
jgi:hypothetical protein